MKEAASGPADGLWSKQYIPPALAHSNLIYRGAALDEGLV